MPVGNDVIDLHDPDTEPGATHPRFLARVCRAEEIARITAAPDPTRLLWIYWAAKESAFKALRKLDPSLPFLPRHFAVTFRPADESGVQSGVVETAGLAAIVWVTQHPDYLHAVAHAGPAAAETQSAAFATTLSGVHCVTRAHHDTSPSAPTDLSAAARRFLVSRLAPHLGCRPADIAVVRGAGRGTPPLVTVRGAPSGLDVSLSHHGRLVAFAVAVPAAIWPPERPRLPQVTHG